MEFIFLEHREIHRFFMQDSLGVNEARARVDRTRKRPEEEKESLLQQEDTAAAKGRSDGNTHAPRLTGQGLYVE